MAELAFTVYLVHKTAIHITRSLRANERVPVDGSVMFVCCLVASVDAAPALRFLVELPFLALRHKWSPSTPGTRVSSLGSHQRSGQQLA